MWNPPDRLAESLLLVDPRFTLIRRLRDKSARVSELHSSWLSDRVSFNIARAKIGQPAKAGDIQDVHRGRLRSDSLPVT